MQALDELLVSSVSYSSEFRMCHILRKRSQITTVFESVNRWIFRIYRDKKVFVQTNNHTPQFLFFWQLMSTFYLDLFLIFKELKKKKSFYTEWPAKDSHNRPILGRGGGGSKGRGLHYMASIQFISRFHVFLEGHTILWHNVYINFSYEI